LASLLPAGTQLEGARLVPGTCQLHFSLQVAGGAAVLAVGGSDGASLVKFEAGATASGCMAGEAPLVALASPSAAGLQVQVVSAADGSAVQQPQTVAGLAPQRVGGAAVGVAALFAGASGRAGDLAFRQAGLLRLLPLLMLMPPECGWLSLPSLYILNLIQNCQAAKCPPTTSPAPHSWPSPPYHPAPAAGSWLCLRTTALPWWRRGSRPGFATRSWQPSQVGARWVGWAGQGGRLIACQHGY
jgi:hypothetical protein